MSKELEALENIKHYDSRALLHEDDYKIVEAAFKRLAVYESFGLLDEKYDDVDKLTDIKGKLTYVDKVMDTQERLLASVSADEIKILNSVLNSQIKTLKRKLKALEIIKAKRVDVQLLKDSKNLNDYNWCVHTKDRALTQEEYDLLKEVLS